jgi:hypothetical protein
MQRFDKVRLQFRQNPGKNLPFTTVAISFLDKFFRVRCITLPDLSKVSFNL